MNPEETDEFKPFEDVLHRLTKVPKKNVDDLEKAEASEMHASKKLLNVPEEQVDEKVKRRPKREPRKPLEF